MLMQKFKTGLRFLGILLMRVLLGIVAGFLWLVSAAFIMRNFGYWIREKIAYRDLDGTYASMVEASERWDSIMGSPVNDIITNIVWIGVYVCIAVGILWGFSQGRLDLRRWLRGKRA